MYLVELLPGDKPYYSFHKVEPELMLLVPVPKQFRVLGENLSSVNS